MLDLLIKGVGVYRHAQRGWGQHDTLFIGYTYRGLREMSVNHGTPVTQCPMLSIMAPNMRADFEFDASRENWVVFAESKDIRCHPNSTTIQIRSDQTWLDVPWYVPVEPAKADWWQGEFMRLAELTQSPTPRDQLAARLAALHVVEQFVTASRESPSPRSPAQRLKQLIDHDTKAERSLNQLAEQCNYSADHLRALFIEQFGVTPAAYRQRRRMAHAMELIMRTQLPIKTIADKLGYAQVAHFSSTFRKAHNLTATEAMKRYRYDNG